MKHGKFFKNVAVITLGSLVAKLIGAAYRIPLANLLGGYGVGIYQMAYPFFCVLLTFSSAGIPTALSRIIARETATGRESGDTVRAALKLFALVGLCAALVMCLLAPFVGRLQGDGNLAACYYALAPAVLLVALISVFRGYFQGKSDMKPTAMSELVEQLVKAGAGMLLVRTAESPAHAAMLALFAVTLSELVALLFLWMRYRGERRLRYLGVRRTSGVDIFSVAFPVMAAASLLPLSQMVDSVVIVRLLSSYTAEAVAMYGLFTGGAVALVNLPASVCYGLAAASVPAVSSAFARGEEEEGRRRALFALLVTIALSLPCAVGLFAFARPIVGLLYSSLREGDAALLVRLLRLSSLSAVLLACVDTLAACLAGMGRAKYAARAMLAAVFVKFALQWVLVSDPAFSVGGAAIAMNACYLVAFLLDLVYTVKKRAGAKRHDHDHRIGDEGGRRDGTGARRHEGRRRGFGSKRVLARRADVEGGGN